MGKWKSLAKYEEKFGKEKGGKLWVEQVRHRRKRTIEIIKALSGIGFLLRILGK